jgi:hypothetical protein
MKRETIAILTLGSFIIFSFSCYSVKPIKPKMLSAPMAGKIEMRKVDKTSGESIEFSKSDPGRVRGNFVEGIDTLARAVEFVEIASADLQTVTHYGETYLSVKTRDGKSYDWVKKIEERGDKSILYVVKAITNRVNSFFRVSLSEVEKAWANLLDETPSALAFLVFMRGCVLGILMFAEVFREGIGAMARGWTMDGHR